MSDCALSFVLRFLRYSFPPPNMSNPIDLCTLGQCRVWLGLYSGQLGNSNETAVVMTTIALALAPGVQTATPASMVGILVNMVMGIDVGTAVEEYVAVSAVSSSSFTANFTFAHNTNSTVTDVTDTVLSRLITSVSTQWLQLTGRVNADGSIPATSSLNSQTSYNEWYDGNGNSRLFLRTTPVVAVSAVFVNGINIPQSVVTTSGSSQTVGAGWAIDQNGRSLVMRNSGGYGNYGGAQGGFYPARWGNVYSWANGIQNINIQYTAGYATVPFDVNDHATRMVGLAYRRKSWAGLKGNAQPQAMGTISYDLTPILQETLDVIDKYRRIAQAG